MASRTMAGISGIRLMTRKEDAINSRASMIIVASRSGRPRRLQTDSSGSSPPPPRLWTGVEDRIPSGSGGPPRGRISRQRPRGPFASSSSIHKSGDKSPGSDRIGSDRAGGMAALQTIRPTEVGAKNGALPTGGAKSAARLASQADGSILLSSPKQICRMDPSGRSYLAPNL